MQEPCCGRGVAGDLETFIHQLRQKGVVLWMEEAGLRYRAPKGVLGADERQLLSTVNGEIAALLEHRARVPHLASSAKQSSDVRRAPLSFTQLEHWYDRLRHGGSPILNIASAFRLQGPLRIELLRESVAAIGRRHDALRTRIVLCGEPVQEVADTYLSNLEVVSLASVPAHAVAAEVEFQIQRVILGGRDYAMSPLFKAVLLEINSSEQVLVLALDHIISDLASLHLLTREVFTAYAQLLEGRPIDLPRVSIQFPDHAATLRAQPLETLTRIARRFGSSARTRFPDDLRMELPHGGVSLGLVRIEINIALGDELRVWARRHGTTTVLATLTAYAALVLRWCGSKDTVIPFKTDGRTNADLEHTIGYLAFSVYIRVTLEKRSTFLDLLRTVTEGYCKAHDEADFGHAIAQEARPEFTRNSAVNWLPAGGVGTGSLVPGTEVVLSRSTLELAGLILQRVTPNDHEPEVSFSELDGIITGHVSYVRNRFSESGMERFAMNFMGFLEAMLRSPTGRIMDVELK